jgi:hypothetical protein
VRQRRGEDARDPEDLEHPVTDSLESLAAKAREAIAAVNALNRQLHDTWTARKAAEAEAARQKKELQKAEDLAEAAYRGHGVAMAACREAERIRDTAVATLRRALEEDTQAAVHAKMQVLLTSQETA